MLAVGEQPPYLYRPHKLPPPLPILPCCGGAVRERLGGAWPIATAEPPPSSQCSLPSSWSTAAARGALQHRCLGWCPPPQEGHGRQPEQSVPSAPVVSHCWGLLEGTGAQRGRYLWSWDSSLVQSLYANRAAARSQLTCNRCCRRDHRVAQPQQPGPGCGKKDPSCPGCCRDGRRQRVPVGCCCSGEIVA